MTDTSTAPILDRARAQMDLESLEAQLRELMIKRAARFPQTRSDAEIIGEVAREVATSGTLPDGIGARMLALRDERDVAGWEVAVLRQAEGHVTARLRARHRDNADAGLTVLADELAEILDVARPVLDALCNVGDADAAIRAKVTDAWEQAAQLAERHDEVRVAQGFLLSAALVDGAGSGPVRDEVTPKVRALLDSFGIVRDAEQHHGPIVAGHLDALRLAEGGPDSGKVNILTGERLVDQAGRAPWLAPNPLDVLRFLVRPDVRPWVPSVAELLAERDRAVEQYRQQQAESGAERDHQAEAERWAQSGRPNPSALNSMARTRGLLSGASINGMTFPTLPPAAA